MTNRKLKLAGILTAGICLLLSGCAGTEKEAPDTEQQTETASAEPQAQQEEAQNATAQEASEAESAETAAPAAEKEPEIIWYMDEEGYKNDILGVTLKKDKAEEARASLSANVMTYALSKESGTTRGTQTSISCEYFDGTLEEYVGQSYPNYISAELNGVSYAYENEYGVVYVVWVDNGIAVKISKNDTIEDVPAYLEEADLFHKLEADEETDKLLYSTDDGLYIPAIGIKIEWNSGKRKDLNSFNLCIIPKEDNFPWINIYQNINYYYGMTRNLSAKKNIEAYIRSVTTPSEYIPVTPETVGEMEEINFGKCTFIGQRIIESTGIHLNGEWKEEGKKYSSMWATDNCDCWIEFQEMPVDSEKTETDYLSIFE